MGGTGILGGTFNPVHNGHIRHAVEVGEALGLERVVLMPCPDPPHKRNAGLLPYRLRLELVRAAVGHIPLLDVSDLEGSLPHPSYTWRTLNEWHRRFGPGEIFFMMGAESFSALDSWYRGTELPGLAHIVMVPRDGGEGRLFHECVRKFWPGSLKDGVSDPAGRETVALEGGGFCTYLPAPRLDISSTFIRERWRAGRCLAGLVPPDEMRLLSAHREEVSACWKDELEREDPKREAFPDLPRKGVGA